MLKTTIMTAVAVSALAIGSQAQAATVVYESGVGQTIDLVAGTNSATGGFNFQVQADNSGSNAFTATYTFDNTFYSPAAAMASVTFSSSNTMIDFTGASFNGAAGTVDINNNAYGGAGANIYFANDPLSLGMNTLTVTGNLVRGTLSDVASGQLTLSASAVPEPATWALMILGFGAVGFAMRKRSAGVVRNRARLTFA